MTQRVKPQARRRYDDACGAAHGLDLIGERWAALVMRELMLGPRRFNDIRAELPGLSANTLTQRLEGLEASGIVRRRRLPPPASVQVYELTDWGLEADVILRELGRWATRSPGHDPTMPLSPVSLMLSFRAMLDPARAKGLRIRAGFRLGRETYWAKVAGSRIEIGRGEVESAAFVCAGAAPAIAAAVYGGVPFGALVADGALTLTGDTAAAATFAGLFPLPPKAEIPTPGEPVETAASGRPGRQTSSHRTTSRRERKPVSA